jgi:DNA-directed RNA polymerase
MCQLLSIITSTILLPHYRDHYVLNGIRFFRQGSTTRRQGLLKCHENIFKYVDEGHVIKEVLDARLLPMVVKPVPWVSPTVGM